MPFKLRNSKASTLVDYHYLSDTTLTNGVSDTYRDHIRVNSKWSNKSFAHQLEVDYRVKGKKVKLWRVKKQAFTILRGYEEEL